METNWKLNLDGDPAATAAERTTRVLTALQGRVKGVDRALKAVQRSLQGVTGAMGSLGFASRNGLKGMTALAEGLGQVTSGAREASKAVRETQRTLSRPVTPRASRASRAAASGGGLNMAPTAADRRLAADLDRLYREGARAEQQSLARERRNALRQQGLNSRGAVRVRWNANLSSASFGARRWGHQEKAAAENQQRIARASEEWRKHQAGIGESLKTSWSVLGGILGTITSVATRVLSTAVGLAAAFGAVAARIGASVLELVQFREGVTTTMGVLLGGRGPEGIARIGEASLARSRAVGRATGLGTRRTAEIDQQVTAGGFRGAMAQRVSAAAADVSFLNSDSTAAERFILQLSQMQRAPRLNVADLRPAAEAANLDRGAVERRAAELAGVTRRAGESDNAYQTRIDHAKNSGRITGAHGAEATLQVLRETTRNDLGGLAAIRSQGMSGAVMRLTGAWDDLVTGISNLERLPGVQLLASTIGTIADSLNGTNSAGQRLQAIVERIVNTSAAWLGQIGPRGIEGAFNRVIDFAERLAPVLRAAVGPFMAGLRQGLGPLMELNANSGGGFDAWIPRLMEFARGLGLIVGFSAQVVAGMTALAAATTYAVGWLSQWSAGFSAFFSVISGGFIADAIVRVQAGFNSVGQAIVDGITNGLRSAWGSLLGTMRELASSLPGPVQRALGIHSPSRVFAQLGRQTAAGMEVGLQQGAAGVEAAITRVAAPSVGGLGAAGGGARGPLIGQLSITVEGGATNEETAGVLTEAVENLLAGLIERAALATG